MKKLVILSILAVPGIAFSQASPKQTVLPQGTPVRLRVTQAISSASAQAGSNVDFETLEDVNLGDLIVVPRGSKVVATITEAVSKRRMPQGGKIAINIDSVRLASGDKLGLSGIQTAIGDEHTVSTSPGSKDAIPGGIIATATIGKDIAIPKDYEGTVYTKADYDLSGRMFTVLTSETHITEEKSPVGALLGSRTAEGRSEAHTTEVTHLTAELTDAARLHSYSVECQYGPPGLLRLATLGCQPLTAGQAVWGYVSGGNLVVQIDGRIRTYSILKSEVRDRAAEKKSTGEADNAGGSTLIRRASASSSALRSDESWQRMKDCAEQTAKIATRAGWVEGDANNGVTLMSWENHYSPKYEKCFIRVNFMPNGANKDRNAPLTYSQLWDAFEAREISDCTDVAKSGVSVYCSIQSDPDSSFSCAACQQFVKDRMEN